MKLAVLLLVPLLMVFFPFDLSAQTPDTSSKNGEPVVERSQSPTPPVQGAPEGGKAAKASEVLNEPRTSPSFVVLGDYSPFDLLIPSKYGVTLGYLGSGEKTWELEYLRGSISVPFVVEDLGAMTDERVSIIGRSYSRNGSFNFSYGLSYFRFSLHLGDKLLNRVTGGTYPSMDLVDIQTLGFNLAFGNRWTFQHGITFGIDWISWAQPVVLVNRKSAFLEAATNQQDRDDVDKAIKVISYFPRLVFLKFQLGMSF